MRSQRCLAVAGLIGVLALGGVAAEAQASPATSPVVGSQAVSGEETRQLNEQDRMFLRDMHRGNLTEITSGLLGLAKGTCPEVRRIAKLLITDHVRLDRELVAVAVRHGVLVPATPNAQQRQQLREVAALSGRDFDVAWLGMQVALHVEALQLSEQELQHGHSPDVKALAHDAMPVIEHHLALVRAALSSC